MKRKIFKKRNLEIAKKIFASFMVPIFVLQMTSFNLLLASPAMAATGDASVAVEAPTPTVDLVANKTKTTKKDSEKPKEEDKKIKENKEESSEPSESTPQNTEKNNSQESVEGTETSTGANNDNDEKNSSTENQKTTGQSVTEENVGDFSQTSAEEQTNLEKPKETKKVDNQEKSQPEDSKKEEVKTEKTKASEETKVETWSVKGDKATTNEPVELNKKYKAPQNEKVTVTFTKLPKNPGKLSIEEITLTDKQVEKLGAFSNKAYDITSDMKNGTFEYDLTLPYPKEKNNKKIDKEKVQVLYTEKKEIKKSDLKNTENDKEVTKKIDSSQKIVQLKGLNHFTIWFVTSSDDTIKVDLKQTGYNEKNGDGDDYATPRNPNEISCIGGVTNVNNISVHWTDIGDNIGNDVKYERQYKVGSGDWTGSEIYTKPYTNFRTFGGSNGNEGTYSSRVRAWIDVDRNGKINNGEEVSNWSNECSITYDKTAPEITFDEPLNDSFQSGIVHLKASCNENCSYVNFWWRKSDESFSSSSKRYHYVRKNGTNFEWDLNTLKAEKADGNTYQMEDGTYYLYAAGKDLAGNWARTDEIEITVGNPPAKPTGLRRIAPDESNKTYVCGAISKIQRMWTDWDDNRESDFDHYEYTSFNAPNGSIGVDGKVFTESEFKYDGNWLPQEGTYGFAVRAVDEAGNKSEWSLSGKSLDGSCQITYDKTVPTGTIDAIKYEDGSESSKFATNWNTPTIIGTAKDANGIKSVMLTIEGKDYEASVTGNNWMAKITKELIDGNHTIKVIITDKAGNETTINKTLVIDTVAPTAIYQQYKDGVEINDGSTAYVNNIGQLTFTGEYVDTNPSANLNTDSYVIFQAQDNGTFAFSNDNKKAYCSWRRSPNLLDISKDSTFTQTDPVPFTNCINSLPEGEYYMAHQVSDMATRKDIPSINQFKDVLGLHFVVDKTAPTTKLSFKANLNEGKGLTDNNGWRNFGVYKSFDEVNLEINDGNKNDDFIQYQILENDADCPNVGNSNYNQKNNGYNVASEVNNKGDGVYSLCYYGKDKAGNIENLIHKEILRVDTTRGITEIKSVSGNSVDGVYYQKQNSMDINFTSVDNESGIARVRAYLYGNLDCSGGEEAIISKAYRDDAVQNPEEVKSYSFNSGELADGQYCYHIWGYDKAQNWTDFEKVPFIIDTQTPKVDITAIKYEDDTESNKFITSWKTPTIIGNIEDDNVDKVELTINGHTYNAVIEGDKWKVNISDALSDNNYSLIVKATDKAGNKTTINKTLIIDTVKPTSIVTTPSNNGTDEVVYSNSWDGQITGTASDDRSGVAEVDLSIQRGSDNRYWNGSGWQEDEILLKTTGTNSWNYALTSPTEDSYTIKSHAIDNAGNQENTYTLTIVYDKTIPTVNLSIDPTNPNGDNSWYDSKPIITLTANDNIKLAKIEYQIDSQAGVWTEYITPVEINDDQHIFYYRSLDKAGNTSKVGVKNVKVDTHNPDTVKSLKANYDKKNHTIKLNWDADNQDIYKVYVYKGKSKKFKANSKSLMVKNDNKDEGATDNKVSRGKKYYYKFISVDEAGNKSDTKLISVKIAENGNNVAVANLGTQSSGNTVSENKTEQNNKKEEKKKENNSEVKGESTKKQQVAGAETSRKDSQQSKTKQRLYYGIFALLLMLLGFWWFKKRKQ